MNIVPYPPFPSQMITKSHKIMKYVLAHAPDASAREILRASSASLAVAMICGGLAMSGVFSRKM